MTTTLRGSLIMTDKPPPLLMQAVPTPQRPVASPGALVIKDSTPHKVEATEEEPYTIKCICNFSDDDGNTIYCETCDSWQHLDCYYPDNREEATREDFAHSCADCKPRPLDRQKAIQRTLRLNPVVLEDKHSLDRKPRRPPSKGGKKKTKPNDLPPSGQSPNLESTKQGSPVEGLTSKRAKLSHKSSHSITSQSSKRSPSHGNTRSNHAHPPSPATTPPDLPDDFQIHHYSEGFCSLYNEHEVPDTHNNAFASLAIPTALARWLREPDAMKQEVGRTHDEVFQTEPASFGTQLPTLDVKDATRALEPNTTLRWRFLKSTTSIEKDMPLIELNGEIGFQKDYCADITNLWGDLSSPLPFVFFHPVLPLYIDTRKEGSLARYVRRSCKPNAQLDTYLSGGSEYHFWLVSDRHVVANEQITLPWDFRLEKTVCARWLRLLGLRDDDSITHEEPDPDESEYVAISNWIDRILSEYGGCACELENNCAFARFHRHYLYVKNHSRASKKKRKSRTHTVSPTSTGQATNSRAPSEAHVDEHTEDIKYDTASSRSKPPSRERTPARQGSLDQPGILTEPTDRDKRKVAMVEDTFRRMEQQQPPRKKKRISDGTPSSKPKSRNTSAAPSSHYVDNGTSRSKSRSPASSCSPNLPSSTFHDSTTRREDSLLGSRRTSLGPRPTYCDAAVQTDPVQGEWFSEVDYQPCRKKIISLSRRLLNNRLRMRAEVDGLKSETSDSSTFAASSMDVDEKPLPGAEASLDAQLSPSHGSEVSMADAQNGQAVLNNVAFDTKTKPLDLRVLMPPVPTFDNTVLGTGLATTPLSSTSSLMQSPLSNASGLQTPFTVSTMNGLGSHPSTIKKKLSLSDYTKKRMNKGAGAASGGLGHLKASISSPDDVKLEITLDSQDKTEQSSAQPPATTNNVS